MELQNVIRRLEELGVGYRKNHTGPFEKTFPHDAFDFNITINRDGVHVHMTNEAGDGKSTRLGHCNLRGHGMGIRMTFDSIVEELIFALTKAEKYIKELPDG